MDSLTLGIPVTIAQNVVYGLPGRLVHVTSTVAIDVSADNTTFVPLTGANTVGVFTSGGFVRCTTGPAVVVCKA
jgi:hypothetical protein